MAFSGFTSADFRVFERPDFAARMAAIRSELRPALLELGQELAPPLSRLLEEEIHPHAASHMRRRVNPPEETWVAFARDARGYKRWTHLRVAASRHGVRVVAFVEDDADEKTAFAQNLRKHASDLHAALRDPRLVWYSLAPPEGEPPRGDAVKPATLRKLGEQLARTKTLKFQAGIPLGREGEAFRGPESFRAAVLEAAGILKPLYLAGVGRL